VNFFELVSSGDAEGQRHLVGDDLAGFFDKLNGETSTIFKDAAVGILAMIRDWGKERVDQVAVGLEYIRENPDHENPNTLTP
jgi:hypothetical protein